LETEPNLEPVTNWDPDPALITDPDPKLQIITDPAGSRSGTSTLLFPLVPLVIVDASSHYDTIRQDSKLDRIWISKHCWDPYLDNRSQMVTVPKIVWEIKDSIIR
jgi:hypothetical protein